MKNEISIEVSGLRSGYGKRPVIKGVDFTIKKGDFVGLIGPNGSGKSTLIKSLIKYLPPAAGKIVLAGSDTSKLTAKEIARRVAVVPQKLEADFSLTGRELVMLGRYPHLKRFQQETVEDKALVEQAMRDTNTIHLRDRPITEVSGGEFQRLVIGQALAQTPEILLLDEPTSHLDINQQIQVCELLSKLNASKGLTIIAVLHDLNLAALYCNEVILLHKGRVWLSGPTQEVMTEKALEEVYGAKVHREIHPLTGKAYFTYYPQNQDKLQAKPAKNGFRVHLVAGGGNAVGLFPLLSSLHCQLSTGVLNINDSDWQKAKQMGINLIEEAPFHPISDESQARNNTLAEEGDLVVLCNIPFGPGNLKNLLTVEAVLKKGKPVIICDFTPITKRDFTGGEGTRIYQTLPKLGATVVKSIDELFDKVKQKMESIVDDTE